MYGTQSRGWGTTDPDESTKGTELGELMDRQYMVKQYVAVVKSRTGQRFMVFRTGDEKYYLFDPIDKDGCSYCRGFPVLKADLRSEIRRALSHGWGNAGIWEE